MSGHDAREVIRAEELQEDIQFAAYYAVLNDWIRKEQMAPLIRYMLLKRQDNSSSSSSSSSKEKLQGLVKKPWLDSVKKPNTIKKLGPVKERLLAEAGNKSTTIVIIINFLAKLASKRDSVRRAVV